MEAEICGVLLGTSSDGCTHVDACIAGERAAQGAAHVTFTQNTWEHIYAVKDKDFPDKKIVGWYHSHPGFGVFLSHHDTFIHENFFSDPHQVAWVFDPHSDEEGCFGWSDGEIRRLRRFEIAAQVPDTPPQPEPDIVTPPQTTLPAEPKDSPPQKRILAVWERIPIRAKLALLVTGLVVLLAVIAFQLSLLFGKVDPVKLPTAKQLVERIRQTIRRGTSSQQVDEPPVNARQTEISSGGRIAPTIATNTVLDARVREDQPDLTRTKTNVEARPRPDAPARATDPLLDSASPGPH